MADRTPSAADTRPEGFKPNGTYEGTGWGIDHDRSHNLVRNPRPVEVTACRREWAWWREAFLAGWRLVRYGR